MGCATSKSKNSSQKIRKPNGEAFDEQFWDDPSIKDSSSREQTIVSIEDIHYYYKFERKVGSGSFGSVNLGVMISQPNKQVAIKTIPKESVQGIPQLYLKREVDIVKRLDHPNICKFLEAYMDKDNIYVVMEYCAGGTLKELIYSHNNSEFNVAKIMQKLFWAVNYMHNNNIVHRDLKLENVIFTSQNPALSDIKIIDFGLSKKLQDKNKRRHTKVGSFNYMAPEVLKHSKYDKECDIWSLGCMMFAMLSAELPFYDVPSIESGTYTFDAIGWKQVSPDAKDLITSMLVVSPEKRITLAKAMKHSWFQRLRKNTLGTIAVTRGRGSKQIVINRMLNFKQMTIFKRQVLQTIVKQMENNQSMTPTDIFALIDKNGNGFISAEDIKEVIRRLNLEGQFKDEKDIQDLIKAISMPTASSTVVSNSVSQTASSNQMANNENFQTFKESINKITYSEFLAATLDEQHYLDTISLKRAFKYLDASETGFINKNDFIDVLAREGRRLPQEDIEAIYSEIEPYLNKSQELDFIGFCNLMRSSSKSPQKDEMEPIGEGDISSNDNSSDYQSARDIPGDFHKQPQSNSNQVTLEHNNKTSQNNNNNHNNNNTHA